MLSFSDMILCSICIEGNCQTNRKLGTYCLENNVNVSSMSLDKAHNQSPVRVSLVFFPQ